MIFSRSLKKKVLFITGASSGIGQRFFLEMTKRHPEAWFFCVGRDIEKLSENLSNVSLYVEAKMWQCDLTSQSSVQDAISECMRYYGKIDEVYHFAGVSCWSSYEDSSHELFERIMSSNFYATNNLLKETLPHLRREEGKFYTTTSVQGIIGVPYHAAYSASKHAVEGLLKSVDVETPEVDFHIIRPSWVSGTNMKSNALSSTGDKIIDTTHRSEKSGNATTLEKAVKRIIKYAEKPAASPLHIPGKYFFLPVVQMFAPKLLTKLIRGKFK